MTFDKDKMVDQIADTFGPACSGIEAAITEYGPLNEVAVRWLDEYVKPVWPSLTKREVRGDYPKRPRRWGLQASTPNRSRL